MRHVVSYLKLPKINSYHWPFSRSISVVSSFFYTLLAAMKLCDKEALSASSTLSCVQVVVNALIQAIPAIFNVLLVCLVFWLLLSIMGVSLFSGRFSSCVDSNGQMIDTSVVANKSACLELLHLNYTWFTPNVTFDNVFSAYLALLQVVAFAFCCRYISGVFS